MKINTKAGRGIHPVRNVWAPTKLFNYHTSSKRSGRGTYPVPREGFSLNSAIIKTY
jgi:hypothetical protein